MEQIKTVLDKIVARFNEKRTFNEDVSRFLNEVLSSDELKHLKFISCKNKICVVNVDTSNWLYCLNFKREPIKNALNKALGGSDKSEAVKEVRFRIGEV